jgi:hypothetical protein
MKSKAKLNHQLYIEAKREFFDTTEKFAHKALALFQAVNNKDTGNIPQLEEESLEIARKIDAQF